MAPQLTTLASWGCLSGLLGCATRLGKAAWPPRAQWQAAVRYGPAEVTNQIQAERQGETMAMVAALESIPQMVRHRVWLLGRVPPCRMPHATPI